MFDFDNKINVTLIVDIVFGLMLLIFLVITIWYIFGPKKHNPSIPTESLIDPSNTDRRFINGTLSQRDFPPEACFDNDRTTYCQSVKRRFPTYRVDMKQSYYILEVTIVNHPDPAKRQLTPLMVILEDETRTPVFKHLVEEYTEEPLEIKVKVNSRGQFLVLQVSSMMAVYFRMSNLEIKYRI